MKRQQMEYELAKRFLSMSEPKRALFMESMRLVADNPARQKFAADWEGKMADLPAALKEI